MGKDEVAIAIDCAQQVGKLKVGFHDNDMLKRVDDPRPSLLLFVVIQ